MEQILSCFGLGWSEENYLGCAHYLRVVYRQIFAQPYHPLRQQLGQLSQLALILGSMVCSTLSSAKRDRIYLVHYLLVSEELLLYGIYYPFRGCRSGYSMCQ